MEENLSEMELLNKIHYKCNVFFHNKTITNSNELTKEDEFYLLELKRRFKYTLQYEIKWVEAIQV
jgi:sulfur relay (sulfurtransferase) complex TusBCD TusD component (DsrE family)